MTETTRDFRGMLRDRRAKATRQNVTHEFCLAPDLIGELEELKAARDEQAHPYATKIAELKQQGKGMMAGPDTTIVEAERDNALRDLDAQIEAKETEIRDASLVLHFRAVKPETYLALVNEHDPDGEGPGKESRLATFMDALIAASWTKATDADGNPTDLAWTEISDSVASWGELDAIRSKVFAANKMGVDLPFSLRNSGKTRTAGRR